MNAISSRHETVSLAADDKNFGGTFIDQNADYIKSRNWFTDEHNFSIFKFKASTDKTFLPSLANDKEYVPKLAPISIKFNDGSDSKNCWLEYGPRDLIFVKRENSTKWPY
jgi:hypothetical protein